MLPEERFGEEIHVASRSDKTLADDGKHLLGEGRYTCENLIPEERSGEEIHVAIPSCLEAGGLLQNHIYIYIYIYTKTQHFRISILERFWRGFGEVPKRDFGEQKSQNSCVLQCFLMVTIKHSLVS